MSQDAGPGISASFIPTAIGVGESCEKPNRSKACNECKQQKLRCNLASNNVETCARCQRLHLECRVESGFKRTRKRRRSFELASQVRELRQQLGRQNAPAAPMPSWSDRSASSVPQCLSISPHDGSVSQAGTGPDTSLVPVTTNSPCVVRERHSRTAGLTTKPAVDEPERPRHVDAMRQPRALGNIALSENEIDQLFLMYMTHYQPFLPLLDPGKSPHEYYAASELLFWIIISIAARRLHTRPTLLAKLTRSVTDLLWTTIRGIPYSLETVQALALLCTWPFPTCSSTNDPTFMLAGLMIQLATQMGLHRALDAQDFVKVPHRLTAYEFTEWVRTWQVCNIVVQRVSDGCGLPTMLQMSDWSLATVPMVDNSTTSDTNMRLHLRIEQFRHRISHFFMSGSSNPNTVVSCQEKLSLYRLLNSSLADLEIETQTANLLSSWYLSAARVHLHALYLFDDSAMDGYAERIISLYHSSYNLIEKSLQLDERDCKFFDYCPFSCYQAFACAAFVVLRVLSNAFFQPLLDDDAGMQLLDSAIVAFRKMSVVNNDLPARLGDVLGFFCTLSDRASLGGATMEVLQLQQVKNRLSMSVVYDSLWTWRHHFKDNDVAAESTGPGQSRPNEAPFPFLLQSLDFSTPNCIGGLTDIDWLSSL